MKLITRDTDYAVRALSFIAKTYPKDKIISVRHLAKKAKIPQPFLRKILQILNKNGLLISYKGFSGGFILAREPADIFISDLIEIFQGPLKLNECLFKKRICPEKRVCGLRKRLDYIERYVISELKNISIESLL